MRFSLTVLVTLPGRDEAFLSVDFDENEDPVDAVRELELMARAIPSYAAEAETAA